MTTKASLSDERDSQLPRKHSCHTVYSEGRLIVKRRGGGGGGGSCCKNVVLGGMGKDTLRTRESL